MVYKKTDQTNKTTTKKTERLDNVSTGKVPTLFLFLLNLIVK